MDKKAKIYLFLIVVFSIIWLGAINIRFLIGNELLVFDEFNFRTSIPPDEENLIFKQVSNSSIVIIASYCIVFLSAIFFLKFCKINLKENPWLLMCAILFFMFSPVEFYSHYLDIKFIMLFNQRPENHDVLLKIFGERIGLLRGVPWIALLSYYFIIWCAIFQPMKKTADQLEQEKSREKLHSYNYIFHEDDDLAVKDN
ncbi:MAG TPA: hypothetical protein DEP28_04370 [Bacteroidetes bacterium]|nr:hypothetical protein [Bacteroidota bacterium]HCN37128.1 hypothetical protein [Bacteroidota bacterium]